MKKETKKMKTKEQQKTKAELREDNLICHVTVYNKHTTYFVECLN